MGSINHPKRYDSLIGIPTLHKHQRTRAGHRRIGPHQPAPSSRGGPKTRPVPEWHPQTKEISMLPARPYWKGYLKLSLVSCPIALYSASSSTERVSFRQINRKTGHRLRQQLIDEVTREPVEADDKGRGYEVAKNTYILIDDAELEAIQIESNQTIEIDSFV